MLSIIFSVIAFNGCDDDDDGPTTFTISTLTAGTADLNGATSATEIPVDAVLTATFNTDVEAATASESNITLKRGFDQSSADIDIAVSGKTVTITPVNDLSSGAEYILAIGAGVESTNNIAFTAAERSFKTAGTFVPDDQVAYYNFNDNTDDQVGSFDSDVETAITYSAGRNAVAGKAAVFNGTTSIVEIPNGDDLLTPEFTISFWMDLDTASVKANGAFKGHFVMGVGAFNGVQFEVNDREEWFKFATKYNSPTGYKGNDFFFNANGETRTATGLDISTTVDEDYGRTGIRQRINNWVNIIFTQSIATKIRSIYINGELVMQQDFKLLTGSGDAGVEPFGTVTGLALEPSVATAGQPDFYDNKWAFGFWESSASTFPSWGADCCQYGNPNNNHFKGALDDIRFFNRAISEQEIELMYASEKP